MTTTAPRVGDTLTTAEQLDALPDKAVVLDEHEEPWQKLGEGLWCGRADGPMSGSALLRTRTDEVTVLYVPGEQPGRSTDQALAEAWAEGHRTGWEHCQDGNYGNDHWDDPTPNPYAATGRPSVTDNALAEAWDEGYQDGLRQGGEGEDGPRYVNPYRAAGRAETTTATDEDAARVINEVLGGDMDNHARIAAHRLADAGLLATARTHPTREQVLALIPSPQRTIYVAGWPEDEQEMHRRPDWRSFEERGKALDLYRREKVADAVLALYADQPTEAEAGARALEQAAEWLRSDMDEPWGDRAANRLDARAARIRAGGA